MSLSRASEWYIPGQTVLSPRVGNYYLEVLHRRIGVVAWVLRGALLGVTWALPGLFFWEVCFGGPKIFAFLNLKLLKKIIFT